MARAALEQLALEKVLWMPTGKPRYRDAPIAAPEHRLAMLRLALEGEPAFELDARELVPGASGYTVDTLHELRLELNVGQYLDLLGTARADRDPAVARRIARYKSGKYTIERPLHVGAALAGRLDDLSAPLSAYGDPLGEAFQLRDDVLGVFGDPDRTGKPAGDDLREGKRTLLVALAMQAASAVEAELLKHELGDRTMDEAAIAALREVIVSTGALDQVEQRIAQRTDEAREALRTDAISAEARTALDDLAVAATDRTV